jgi:hypothetical protein
MLTLVAGVEPVSPGFKTVKIAPHLGDLKELKASFPHPDGAIKVDFDWKPEHIDPGIKGGRTFYATIELPGTLTGTFEIDGRSWPLKPGISRIEIPQK